MQLERRALADPDALRVQFFDQPFCDLEMRKVYCAVEVALYDLASKALGWNPREMSKLRRAQLALRDARLKPA